ncbi:cuticle protein 8-like [Uranotaenia lowii]|uniref:cuticle protein 8-like n=1 Tax=Uranotaenia lowii TaxID=190385 RepID=UPI00247B0CE4|nr:cuticle protein 8-like [Uranotaenia lowii]
MLKHVTILVCFGAIALALPYKSDPEPHHVEHHETHSHPLYQFEYGVKDGHTGDYKSQWEHRDGDQVKGLYTLVEPDGGHRIVEYQSDNHGGIDIQVKKVSGSSKGEESYYKPKQSAGGLYVGESYASVKKL